MAEHGLTIAVLYRDKLMSIPSIAANLNLPRSRVRDTLIREGVTLRSRGEGIRLRRDVLGKHALGKRRDFTPEWKQNIKMAALRRGDQAAKGVSLKASGYIEITRGDNKGRGEHVIKMERRLGRKLLDDECVHHIDNNRSNNSDDNLALVTRAGHMRLHRREQRIQREGEIS